MSPTPEIQRHDDGTVTVVCGDYTCTSGSVTRALQCVMADVELDGSFPASVMQYLQAMLADAIEVSIVERDNRPVYININMDGPRGNGPTRKRAFDRIEKWVACERAQMNAASFALAVVAHKIRKLREELE